MRAVRAYSRIGAALVVIAFGTAGCARDGDQATATSVTNTFFGALAAGDGTRACEQLSPDTRAALENQEKSACRQAITGLNLDSGAVMRANVYLLNALVELSNGDAVFLGQGEEGWRIDAVGCKPSAKPVARPFECELED